MNRETIACALAGALLVYATTANAGLSGWKCGQTEVWQWVDKSMRPYGSILSFNHVDFDLFEKQGLHFRPHRWKNVLLNGKPYRDVVEYLLNGKPCRYWDPVSVEEMEAQAARRREQAKTILNPYASDYDHVARGLTLSGYIISQG
jgi:hypothetical protein